VHKYLRKGDEMEVLVVKKQTEWAGFDTLDALIREHMKGRGFNGELDIRLEASDELVVHRNSQWANFLH